MTNSNIPINFMIFIDQFNTFSHVFENGLEIPKMMAIFAITSKRYNLAISMVKLYENFTIH